MTNIYKNSFCTANNTTGSEQVQKPEQVVYGTPDEAPEEEISTRVEVPNDDINTTATDFTDNYRKMRKLTFPSGIAHEQPLHENTEKTKPDVPFADYDSDVVVPLPDGATRTVFRSHMDTAPPHEKVIFLNTNVGCTQVIAALMIH